MGFFQIGAFIVALLAIVGAAARIRMFNLERERLAMERRRMALYEADLRRRGVYASNDELRERIRREWEDHGG
jgi:hypothetical protein